VREREREREERERERETHRERERESVCVCERERERENGVSKCWPSTWRRSPVSTAADLRSLDGATTALAL
jgi:hypothetical protein